MDWLRDLGTGILDFGTNIGSNVIDYFTTDDGGVDYSALIPALTAFAASRAGNSETLSDFYGLGAEENNITGYQGGIPSYTYSPKLVPNAFSDYERDNAGVLSLDVNEQYIPRRPGGKGRRYFEDASFVTKETDEMAGGGLASLNNQGYYLGGPTDGMADQVPAMIGNSQPAALSDGEFVIPADVVSHLGNGNSDAGAQNLYSMMERVRKDRTGNPKQGKEINPNSYLA